jgi:hypothetical protein
MARDDAAEKSVACRMRRIFIAHVSSRWKASSFGLVELQPRCHE